MGSDKNQNFLEKQLKTLGQKVRIDILKKLNNSQDQISFSKLQKEVLEGDFSSPNFSFHLNELKKCELINSTEYGYYITTLGKGILENILSIEQILLDKSKTRMIRTSKYSKENFDSSKIEEYLINEGELERFLARKIAREVEERLDKTNIEYLTAPLMREYINAVLLENGLEEVRHKLTRLGTPPFEVFKLFNSKDLTPDIFIKQLGSDVSEQFLLLNLLPKKLADLYLSGEIALLHLNYWSLRPLSIYINSNTLLEYIFNNTSSFSKQLTNERDFFNLIINFFDFLHKIKQFCSEDIVLGDFNNAFLNKFSSLKERTYMVDLLTSQFSKYNENFHNIHKHLTLDFNFRSDSAKANSINHETIITLIDSIKSDTINGNGMLWEFGFSNFTQLSKENDYIFEILSSDLRNSIIIYNNNYSSLLNSTLTKINNPQSNELILDKILINLHLISVEANQNDELFLEKLQDKMNSVFELFKFKEQLVKKKLKSNKQWKTLNSIISGKNEVDIFQKAIKSISFFGLNTAITNHCGIELDRTDNSLRFALNIFTLMRKLIEEHNGGGDNRYLLNQPHDGKYLSDSLQNGLSKQNQSLISYSPRFIRESSSLELTKKIDLYRKFENLISGGSVFNQIINQDRVSLKDDLKTIFNSTINAISFKS